jgi:hypothetical protein
VDRAENSGSGGVQRMQEIKRFAAGDEDVLLSLDDFKESISLHLRNMAAKDGMDACQRSGDRIAELARVF